MKRGLIVGCPSRESVQITEIEHASSQHRYAVRCHTTYHTRYFVSLNRPRHCMCKCTRAGWLHALCLVYECIPDTPTSGHAHVTSLKPGLHDLSSQAGAESAIVFTAHYFHTFVTSGKAYQMVK